MTAFLTTMAASASMEYFLSGVVAAISLYCGTKLPKNKRR